VLKQIGCNVGAGDSCYRSFFILQGGTNFSGCGQKSNWDTSHKYLEMKQYWEFAHWPRIQDSLNVEKMDFEMTGFEVAGELLT
jgi:hypothetical protein